MSRKGKIDPTQKVQLVEMYLRAEISITEGTRLAGLNSRASFKDWVSIYKNGGPAGLLDQAHNKYYPKELKLAAVNSYLNGEGSILDITNRF